MNTTSRSKAAAVITDEASPSPAAIFSKRRLAAISGSKQERENSFSFALRLALILAGSFKTIRMTVFISSKLLMRATSCLLSKQFKGWPRAFQHGETATI